MAVAVFGNQLDTLLSSRNSLIIEPHTHFERCFLSIIQFLRRIQLNGLGNVVQRLLEQTASLFSLEAQIIERSVYLHRHQLFVVVQVVGGIAELSSIESSLGTCQNIRSSLPQIRLRELCYCRIKHRKVSKCVGLHQLAA